MNAMSEMIAERTTAAPAARTCFFGEWPSDRVQERHIAWRYALRQERLVRALVGPLPGDGADARRPAVSRHRPRLRPRASAEDAGARRVRRGLPRLPRDLPADGGVAFLPDVARIERAVWRALHAQEAPPMCHADLSVAALAQPELLFLRLHPALGSVGSRHPALSIWSRRVFPGLAGATIAWSPESLFVTRLGDRVYLERVSEAEHAFLQALRSEACLAEARAAGAAVEPGFDSARLLDRLVTLGQITGAC
jgi:hypothetical protein